jgi:hypothetical protein
LIEIIRQNFTKGDFGGGEAVAKFNRMPGSVAGIHSPSSSNVS